MTERIIDKVVRQLDNLPSPKVDNLHKASKDELAEEFITMRMWCGSVLLWMKDVRQDYSLLHERLTDLQRDVNELQSTARSTNVRLNQLESEQN